uniref:Conjugal transfer protein TraG n=1 Tax=Caenorhabditis tropicalis TaxID=1561998 RepID=A0A1I7UCP2_9PELO
MCRCRQDHIRASEEKHDRAVQLQNFEQGFVVDSFLLFIHFIVIISFRQAKNGTAQTNLKAGNRLSVNDLGRSMNDMRSHREEAAKSQETIGQYEERITGVPSSSNSVPRGGAAAGIAQRFRDEEAAKNKRLDTISEIAMSNDSLQRNDSKTNVFNNIEGSRNTISPMEVDLNPGLSSSINLEKI